jgi:hypothetical protein
MGKAMHQAAEDKGEQNAHRDAADQYEGQG